VKEPALISDLKYILNKYPTPDAAIERREDALFVQSINGGDLPPWNTNDVLLYFSEYGPSHIEWITGDQLNVVFEDNFTARRALEFLGEKLDVLEDVVGKEQSSYWRRGKEPIRHTKNDKWGSKNSEIPVLLRIATVEDVKKVDVNKVSRVKAAKHRAQHIPFGRLDRQSEVAPAPAAGDSDSTAQAKEDSRAAEAVVEVNNEAASAPPVAAPEFEDALLAQLQEKAEKKRKRTIAASSRQFSAITASLKSSGGSKLRKVDEGDISSAKTDSGILKRLAPKDSEGQGYLSAELDSKDEGETLGGGGGEENKKDNERGGDVAKVENDFDDDLLAEELGDI
jgi:hypothetical protein